MHPTVYSFIHQGIGRALNYVSAGRRFVIALLIISLALHLFMALGLGAKYWFDSMTYFQLADAIASRDTLRSLYAGPFGTIFQHVMPGLPILIVIFENLFGSAMWPAFAIFQNALDIFACVYLATGFSGYISKPGQLAVVVGTALFPYFSAFHNAILTESLTSSIVMFIIGLTTRCLDGRLAALRGVMVILALGVIGGQIRGYVIGISGGMSFLIIFYSTYRRRPWLYLEVAATVAIGVLIFPLYRVASGIEFFLPRVDALMLMHAHYTNWALDERSRNALEVAVLDPKIVKKLNASNDELDVSDVLKMVDDLMATGLSRSEAISRIGRAGWIVRTQSAGVIARQLQLSLSSLGFQLLPACCAPSRLVAFGYTGKRLFSHLSYYYRWNAGLDGGDYVALFRTFEEMYRPLPYYSDAAIGWYTSRVLPFVRAHSSPARDFFKISIVPPDVLISLGLAGFVVMSRSDRRLIIILLLVFAPVYLSSLSVGVGDNRYAHLLWPLYFVGIVALIEWIHSQRIRRKQEKAGSQGSRLMS